MEWVQDVYAAYPRGRVEDSVSLGPGGAYEYKGCGWSSAEDYCRPAFRGRLNVTSKDMLGESGKEDILGFRPARTAR